MPEFQFTTGPASLPDVGKLDYNGCTFSPLFTTEISGEVVRDNSQRTTKYMDYTLVADGYTTLPDVEASIADSVMPSLRSLLTVQGGPLTYQGRGFDLVVNSAGGGGVRDVAWGPVPKLLEFQPLGAGRSAKVKWQVSVRIPEITRATVFGIRQILQFNYETSVTYNEDGYSSLSVKGTLEVPLTRRTITDRTQTTAVDQFRSVIGDRIMAGIDLSRYRVTRREFPVTRDKRTIEFSFAVEEKSPMDLPPDCTIARGSFSFRPVKSGTGLANWLCTLRASYVVRPDRPPRVAWFAFLALVREYMRHSVLSVPGLGAAPQNNPGVVDTEVPKWIPPKYDLKNIGPAFWSNLLFQQDKVVDASAIKWKAWIIDFSGEGGLYLDSKNTSFSITWRLTTEFQNILLASGIWSKVPERDAQGNNLWAVSMSDVMGSNTWMQDKLDPKLDVIVDFGGP